MDRTCLNKSRSTNLDWLIGWLFTDSEDQHNKVLVNLTYERDEYRRRLLTTRHSLTEVTGTLVLDWFYATFNA